MNRNLIKTALMILLAMSVTTTAAQTSNVTATITDPDGQTWNNGTFVATFIPTPFTQQPSSWQGTTNFTKQVRGSLSAGGVMTVSVADNTFVSPPGSNWQFTLCPNSSAPCQNTTQLVFGAAPNLSTQLSNQLISPRFSPGPNAFGYLDLEVIGPPAPGATYWNVSNGVQRIWNGSAWTNSSSSAGTNLGAFYAQRASCGTLTNCTQLKADGRYVTDATSNSTTTITCPNNDCNFTIADVGKTVWGTTQGSGAGIGLLIFTTYVCPVTTIQTINSAQSITVGTACTANGTANVALYWATDDGTALAALDATVGCSTVYLPDAGLNGNYILTSKPFLVTAPAPATCLQTLTSTVGAPAPSLVGTGFGASQTVLMMSPNFAWGNCGTISGASQKVCIGGTARTISNLQVVGSGLTSASNANCANGANEIVVSASPVSSTIYGVDVAGVCPGQSGMIGVELNSFDETFDLGGVQQVGTIAVNVHNASSVVMRQDDMHNANVTGGIGVRIENGAQALDIASYPIVSISVLGKYQTRASHVGYTSTNGSGNAITVASTGQYISYGDYISTDGGTLLGLAPVGINVASGGTLQILNTQLSAATTSISNLGTVLSGGGNKLGAVIAGSTGSWSGVGVLVGTCRGTATSSATLGLYGLGQFATANCTSTTVNLGVAVSIVPLSGSVFGLVANAGTGCKSGNTCVFTVLKNGAATSITCSMVGPAATCIDTTHFDIPVAGDTYSIQFTTGATETLANVTATLIDW